MISFTQFVESYSDIFITPKEETLKTYEWVVDKELMPKDILNLFKKPIMYSYDNKSHDIKKVKSMTYYNGEKTVYCAVLLDNDKEVVLKVFYGIAGQTVAEAKPFKGTVKHNSEFNPSDLTKKFSAEETRRQHSKSVRDFYN
jgi:hypothetical protein